MALVARPQHDIILRPSIPLAATSDQPVAEVVRPPEAASNNTDDQSTGVAKEISPQEAAELAAARQGDPTTAEIQEQDPPAGDKPKPATKKADEATPNQQTEGDEEDGLAIDETAPAWAKKQVSDIRKRARDRVAAIRAATQAEVGDAKWNEAWEAANSNVSQKYREEVAKAQAEGRRITKEKAELEKKLAEVETARKPPEEAKPDPRPQRDQFDDPDQYDDALIAWGERETERKFASRQADEQAAAAKVAADKKTQEEADAKAEQDRLLTEENAKIAIDWQTKVSAAQEKYGDYDEIVMRAPADGGPEVTQMMAEALTRTENGPDVAYWLALNTDESLRIAQLANPLLQFGEIMKLSGRLSAAAAPRRTQLPPPIKPIANARPEPVAPDPDDESMESYAARRTKELVGTRHPFFPNGGLH